jgi:hypothetical protein
MSTIYIFYLKKTYKTPDLEYANFATPYIDSRGETKQ